MCLLHAYNSMIKEISHLYSSQITCNKATLTPSAWPVSSFHRIRSPKWGSFYSEQKLHNGYLLLPLTRLSCRRCLMLEIGTRLNRLLLWDLSLCRHDGNRFFMFFDINDWYMFSFPFIVSCNFQCAQQNGTFWKSLNNKLQSGVCYS